nr:amidase family protein [Caldilineaceae bacterium]
MNDLIFSSATELARRIREREVSSAEVVEAHLRRIAQVNPALNAVVTLAEDAYEQARRADAALHAGELRGPLHGVPMTIKDSFDTAGEKPLPAVGPAKKGWKT